MIKSVLISPAKQLFRFFSSLKTAIPLLVLTIIVTIGGSLLPTPDFFRTWWYLGLLGLNGISLLFITILHTPMILARKGRNALIGVVLTHTGILILIAGAIYGGISGFRHEVQAIEGEVTIIPGLPFAIHLEKMVVEEYPEGTFPKGSEQSSLKKRQDSHISILVHGRKQANFIIRPGVPARFEGTIILPSLNQTGWIFELMAVDNRGRSKTFPVKPWAPPIFTVGRSQIMAHGRQEGSTLSAEIFTMVNGQVTPLGVVDGKETLSIDDHTLSLGIVKRYTGLSIYNRPHEPVLIAGCLAMMFGLIWHFYFRHRDRSRKDKPETVSEGRIAEGGRDNT